MNTTFHCRLTTVALHIAGGYGYENQRANPWYSRSTVEVIDTATDEMEAVSSLHYAVHSAAAVYVSSVRQIYVIGGVAGNGMVDTIQISNALYGVKSVFIGN